MHGQEALARLADEADAAMTEGVAREQGAETASDADMSPLKRLLHASVCLCSLEHAFQRK